MSTKNNLVEHPDHWDKFKTWLDENFLKRNEGYYPTNTKLWWNRVERSHQDLRKFLGGVRRERRYRLASQQNPATPEEVKPIVKEILEILPDYLKYYGYSEDVFLMPTIPQGTHNVIKVAKHIRTHAGIKIKEGKEDKLKILDKALSTLGAIWAKNRTSDIELEVTLSTSPRGFILLGHYGPDQDSCFRQGSDKTAHKWILGQSKNTFVLTISQLDKKKNKFKNVARSIGFTDADLTVFNFSNYYFVPGFQEGDALEVIGQFLEELWNDKSSFLEDQVYISKEIFHNPYGRWTFAKGENLKRVSQQSLTPNVNNINIFICPHCGRNCDQDRNWQEVDDEFVCDRCVAKANTCELSDKRTLQPLVGIVSKDGDFKHVLSSIAKNFSRCPECDNISEELLKVGHEDIYVCGQCIGLYYINCECCDTLIKEDELFEPSTIDICKPCVNSGNSPVDDDIMSILSDMLI